MLNQIILVGRLVETPKVIETESGKKMSYITLAIPKSFKNADGKYDNDFIDCVLWEVVAESISEYCKQGEIVGIKANISVSVEDDIPYILRASGGPGKAEYEVSGASLIVPLFTDGELSILSEIASKVRKINKHNKNKSDNQFRINKVLYEKV